MVNALSTALKGLKSWGIGQVKKLPWKEVALSIKRSIVFQQLWKHTGNPDVLLGIIPIYTAQRYEVARSQDKMKYRAVAGQFFAHQRGGNVGVKIVLYLVGGQALNYLTYLQILHQLGSARDETFNIDEYAKLPAKTPAVGVVSKQKLVSAAVAPGGPGLTGTRESTKNKAWLTSEIHRTFVMVTREEIIHNMYIESLIYERDVALGDALKVTIMCRQYIAPPKIVAIRPIKIDHRYKDPNDKESSPNYLQTKDIKQKYYQSAFDVTFVDAYVAWETPKKAELVNTAGIVENIFHRLYVDYYGDPLTYAEMMRSKASRMNDGIFRTIGKIFASVPKSIHFALKRWFKVEIGSKYKHLLKAEFPVGETGEVLELESDGLIEFITNISSNNTEGTLQTITLDKDGKTYNAYCLLQNKLLYYQHAISNGLSHGDLNSTSHINLALKSPDSNFYILFYREDDYNYNVYSYTEKPPEVV